MTPVAKITVSLASLALLAGMTACAPTPTPTVTPASTPEAEYPLPTATPPITELPAWARSDDQLWIVYPDGFECSGTEGCPNDFVAAFGEPADPLPEGVAYYDAECMDGRYVQPLEQSPYMTEGNTMRLDGPVVSAPDVPPVTCS